MTEPSPLDRWQRLLHADAADLHAAVAGLDDPPAPSALARCREHWSRELVELAIALRRARVRARGRLRDADRLVADETGVSIATSSVVAAHKAQRFARLGPRRIVDACCGIGGDAMALVSVSPVLAVDRRRDRAWMARRNAGCDAAVADATRLRLRGATVHLDPQRRDDAGARRHRYAEYQPDPGAIAAILDDAAHAAVKLGPGVDIEALPTTERRELEFVTEGRTLVQAILWSGDLADVPEGRTATRLPDGATRCGLPGAPPVGDTSRVDRYLFVPDPALERAQLLGDAAREHGLVEAAPGLGLLTGDSPARDPMLDAYAVLAILPWREARIAEALRAEDAGEVIVRTRGRAVDADAAARRFRGAGDRIITLFGLRLGTRRIAVLAIPADAAPTATV